jgi:hypothetical protein
MFRGREVVWHALAGRERGLAEGGATIAYHVPCGVA